MARMVAWTYEGRHTVPPQSACRVPPDLLRGGSCRARRIILRNPHCSALARFRCQIRAQRQRGQQRSSARDHRGRSLNVGAVGIIKLQRPDRMRVKRCGLLPVQDPANTPADPGRPAWGGGVDAHTRLAPTRCNEAISVAAVFVGRARAEHRTADLMPSSPSAGMCGLCEPVSGPERTSLRHAKRKLENIQGRLAPERRPVSTEKRQDRGSETQTLRLTVGNVEGSSTLGVHYPETGLAG